MTPVIMMLTLKYCSFWRPTSMESVSDGCLSQAHSIGPLGNGQGFIVDGQKSVVGSVTLLLFRCSPAAIIRFIVSVTVGKSIKAMFWARSWPHIAEKSFKVQEPFLTHLNPATAIVFVVGALRVVATLLGRLPSLILGSAVTYSWSMPMFHNYFVSQRNVLCRIASSGTGKGSASFS